MPLICTLRRLHQSVSGSHLKMLRSRTAVSGSPEARTSLACIDVCWGTLIRSPMNCWFTTSHRRFIRSRASPLFQFKRVRAACVRSYTHHQESNWHNMPASSRWLLYILYRLVRLALLLHLPPCTRSHPLVIIRRHWAHCSVLTPNIAVVVKVY